MSDSDGKKTLGLRGGSRSGQVKQSFSHGRTKNVVVETKRKRVVVPKPGADKPAGGASQNLGDPSKRPAGISDAEMERRLKALQAAKANEAEEQKQREEDEKRREEERLRRREEAEAKEREQREIEEAARQKAEEEERKKREAAEAETRAAAAPAASEPVP
ncbi:MAG: IF-2-associated domain-containing protein, partial [Paracoccaceae bacterium]